jgi:hypothetical protein
LKQLVGSVRRMMKVMKYEIGQVMSGTFELVWFNLLKPFCRCFQHIDITAMCVT